MADPGHPRKFSEEFKRQIVRMHESGEPASEMFEEYGLCNSALRRWVKGVRESGSAKACDNRTAGENEPIGLRRENKRPRMEVDVLKQAALIFARKRR